MKWILLLVLIFSSMGCASVNPKLFQSTIADNPHITPEQLQTTLKLNPVIDKQIRSVRYQAYKVGFFNTFNAIYFQNGQIVKQAPYDDYTNLKVLLQLGAIGQEEYDKKSYCEGDKCTCLVPVDCNGVCGGPATLDTCGYCNGFVTSCSYPYSCVGDSCDCTSGTDCNGTCGGSATIDSCGVCGGNGSSCAPSS